MKKQINKKELAKIIAKKKKTSAFNVLKNIESLFSSIENELACGNDVRIVGFGTFKCIKRKPRTIINPKSGKRYKIGERIAFKFSPGSHISDIFKKTLN